MAGRDKGYYFIVSEVLDNYVYIIDGYLHKIENPKYKKVKHLENIGACDDELKQKLILNKKLTNQEVKKALSTFQEA